MWLFFNTVNRHVNRYYCDVWLNENVNQQAPRQDEEISSEKQVFEEILSQPRRKTGGEHGVC